MRLKAEVGWGKGIIRRAYCGPVRAPTGFLAANKDVLVVATILVAADRDVLDAEVLLWFPFDRDKATNEIGNRLQLGSGWRRDVPPRPPRFPVSFDPIGSVDLFEEGVTVKGAAVKFGRRGGVS